MGTHNYITCYHTIKVAIANFKITSGLLDASKSGSEAKSMEGLLLQILNENDFWTSKIHRFHIIPVDCARSPGLTTSRVPLFVLPTAAATTPRRKEPPRITPLDPMARGMLKKETKEKERPMGQGTRDDGGI